MSEVQTALNSAISPKDPVDRVYKTKQIAQPTTRMPSIPAFIRDSSIGGRL